MRSSGSIEDPPREASSRRSLWAIGRINGNPTGGSGIDAAPHIERSADLDDRQFRPVDAEDG
jgi:hypothetical protein